MPPSLTGLSLAHGSWTNEHALERFTQEADPGTLLSSFPGTLLSLGLGTFIDQWGSDLGALSGSWSQHQTSLVLWWDQTLDSPPGMFWFAKLQKLVLVLVLVDCIDVVLFGDFAGCSGLQDLGSCSRIWLKRGLSLT